MLLQKKSGDGQEFLSRKKLSRKKLSIFVSKISPATGVMLLPKIPLPKKLSEMIARFSTQKIDPATGVRAGPAEMPFRNWYTANTNHFNLNEKTNHIE